MTGLMRKVLGGAVLALATAALGLQALRRSDARREASAWRELERLGQADDGLFDTAMVADLPDPARRYFLFAIAPGARLGRGVCIDMTGELSLGSKSRPKFMPMTARQILVGEHGFIWRLRAGSGAMSITGSDGYAAGEGWTRFWLANFIPVARAAGGSDIARSAAGRAVAESLFWAPANLLPREGVSWEAVDASTARVRVIHGGHEHVVDLTVEVDGRPRSVLIQRWSRENPERVWRLQPFGGTVEGVVEIDGYRLAERVTGGNGFGTPDYFAFYRARVTRIQVL